MPFTRRQALFSMGTLAAASTLPLKSSALSQEDSASGAQASEVPVCLTDFEPLAKGKMQSMAWEFLNAGAGDELTLRWNKEACQHIRLKPHVLVDASHLDTRVTLFGQENTFPILLAPVSAHTLFHPDGELATVRGATAAQATMVLSSFSSTSLEDVAAKGKTPLWFQLYAQSDHGLTKELVQRAEAAGYRALCLTVDTPVSGARNREARAHVKLPPMPNFKNSKDATGGVQTGAARLFSSVLDPALNWKDVDWLRSFAKIPLLLKGVLNPDDADQAVKTGVAGIIVSNHGGRNLDTVPATIDALPLVSEKVAGRIPVLVDGGIRRGTDVLKAIALGANAVLIGRPYIYGLSADGETGVTRVLNILQLEFQQAMVLTGRKSIASIDRSVIWPS